MTLFTPSTYGVCMLCLCMLCFFSVCLAATVAMMAKPAACVSLRTCIGHVLSCQIAQSYVSHALNVLSDLCEVWVHCLHITNHFMLLQYNASQFDSVIRCICNMPDSSMCYSYCSCVFGGMWEWKLQWTRRMQVGTVAVCDVAVCSYILLVVWSYVWDSSRKSYEHLYCCCMCVLIHVCSCFENYYGDLCQHSEWADPHIRQPFITMMSYVLHQE